MTLGKSKPSLGPQNKRSSWISKSDPEKEARVVADSFITSHCRAQVVPGTQCGFQEMPAAGGKNDWSTWAVRSSRGDWDSTVGTAGHPAII